jgi:hypothetical protein
MITIEDLQCINVTALAKAGLFDKGDCEGYIGTGDDRLPFIYRAQGAGVIHIGGCRYPFVLVPSNLGRGSLRYFVCPFTEMRTRTLYRPPGASTYAHRLAYRPRVGYCSQLAGRRYHLNRSFQLEGDTERLMVEVRRWQYRGRPTRKARRVQAMMERADRYWHFALAKHPLLRAIAADL